MGREEKKIVLMEMVMKDEGKKEYQLVIVKEEKMEGMQLPSLKDSIQDFQLIDASNYSELLIGRREIQHSTIRLLIDV